MVIWIVGVSGLLWGVLWAYFLQNSHMGRFLALKRTWLTVVIGVGVDMGLVLFIVPFEAWLNMVMVISLSSVGIIGRSLLNELTEAKEVANGYESKNSQ